MKIAPRTFLFLLLSTIALQACGDFTPKRREPVPQDDSQDQDAPTTPDKDADG